MADWTQADWATAALKKLGIVAVGQTPSADDQATASDFAAMLFAQLRRRRLVNFAISAIPDWAKSQLCILLANEIADEFGVGGEKLAIIRGRVLESERKLSIQIASDKPPIPTRSRYF